MQKTPFQRGVRLRAATAFAFGASGVASALAQQTEAPPVTAPIAMPAAAPATPAAPAIPPTWAQGRTAEQAKSTLTPHPPGLTAMAAGDIPTASLKAPPGFKVELYASGMPNARSMTVSPAGVLYVGSRFPGNVYAVVEKDGKREVKVIAKGLHRPNGVVFKNGSLYVAELSKITRYDNIEANLDHPPAPVVVFDAFPEDEAHGWKFMRLSPDSNYLYFQIGTPANITVQPATHATIVRLNLTTNILETVAHSVRNSVGMDFHPVAKELWFTNNGRDWVNDELPNDTLHRLTKKGMNFGYPFCHQGDLLDPDSGRGRSCDESIALSDRARLLSGVLAALICTGAAGAGADAAAGKLKAQTCFACHGESGIAAYFTALPKPAGRDADTQKIAHGQRVSQASDCQSCHGANLEGQKHVPRIAGQAPDYVVTQLRNLCSGLRVDMDGNMASAAKALADEDIEALAAFSGAMQ